jgi:hypothetical protein
MKTATVLAALAAIAAAQDVSSFNILPTPGPSSIRDVEPTATLSFSGPVETGRACGDIADVVSGSRLKLPSVNAEVGLCLKMDEAQN